MPNYEMASLFPSQSISYRDGVQGCPCGCCDCQRGQDGSIRAEQSFMPTYRISPLETASQKLSLSSYKTRAGVAMGEIGFNTRCIRNYGSSNGFLNFSAGSNPTLQPKLHLIDGDPQQNGNNYFTYMPLHTARDSFPSIFDSQTHSAPVEPLHSGFDGFTGLENIETWNQDFWMPVNDLLSPNHAVTTPMPLNIGDSHADLIHSFDRGIFGVSPWVNEPLMSLPISMQDQVLHTSADRNAPLHELYPPFHVENVWNENLQQETENITTLPLFPSNGPFDDKFHNFNSPVGADSDLYTSLGAAEPATSLELRNLMPKPPLLPTDAASSVDSDEAIEKSSSNLGRRRCFTKEEAKETALIREIGACARCFARKSKCTPGDICKPCQKPSPQYTLQHASICPRGRLIQYEKAFFPRIIFAHLDQPDIGKFLSKAEFTNVETRVRLSLGPSYPSVPLVVTEFRTTDENFSHVPDMTSTLNDDKQFFAAIATSHLGVEPSGAAQLQQTCIDYLEIMENDQKFRIGASRITKRVLDAARRFQRTSKFDILLRKSIQIAEIYLVMGKRFFLTREPSRDDAESSGTLPPESSRLLNRQIKSAFLVILKRLVPEALQLLDYRLRRREKETWAALLLTLLLLSSCVEQIQVAVEAFIFAKIPNDDADHFHNRQSGRDTCQSLEQEALEHMWQLVDGNLKAITKPCNPFKARAQMDDDPGMDEAGMNEAEKNLVTDLRQIVIENEEVIAMHAESTYYGGLSRLTSDYRKFKTSNSDRLVSKMIRRFC